MASSADDRRVRKTKKALREGLAVLLEQKKIKDITVRELADLTDMNRGTFYLHYRDIYDLQEQIENEITAEVTEIFSGIETLREGRGPYSICIDLLYYIVDNARMCKVLLSDNGNQTLLNKLSRLLQEQFVHLWIDYFHMEDRQAETGYFGTFLISGFVAMIGKWLDEGMSTPPEWLARQMEALAMHCVGYLQQLH